MSDDDTKDLPVDEVEEKDAEVTLPDPDHFLGSVEDLVPGTTEDLADYGGAFPDPVSGGSSDEEEDDTDDTDPMDDVDPI